MGRRKILIGSIFVLALIMLMPSIPAIQQKTIEDKAYSDFEEEIKKLGFEDIDVLDDDIKLPILYSIVVFILNLMYGRAVRIINRYYFIFELIDFSIYDNKALFIIWYLRTLSLLIPIVYYTNFWYNLSETLGLNWDIEPY